MTELDKKLAKAARECSADAVRRTFEAGLPITIQVGNRIVRRWADGREELVKELPPQWQSGLEWLRGPTVLASQLSRHGSCVTMR